MINSVLLLVGFMVMVLTTILFLMVFFMVAYCIYACGSCPVSDVEFPSTTEALHPESNLDHVRIGREQIIGRQCPICLEEYHDNFRVTILPYCHHIFHTACIFQWFSRSNNTCPSCRCVVDLNARVLQICYEPPRDEVPATASAAVEMV